MLENLPSWLIPILTIVSIVTGYKAFLKFTGRELGIKRNGSNGNKNGGCHVDVGYLTGQLTDCKENREAARLRDEQQLRMLESILQEIKGLREDQSHQFMDLAKEIHVLLDRTSKS